MDGTDLGRHGPRASLRRLAGRRTIDLSASTATASAACLEPTPLSPLRSASEPVRWNIMADFSRIPLITRCVVTRAYALGERRSVDAMLANISVLGTYLILETTLEDGEEVRLRFLLPDGRGAVECEAKVTWVNIEPPQSVDSLPPGCGLRFQSMRPVDHERIARLVEDYRVAAEPMIGRPVPYTGFTRAPYVQPCLIDGVLRGVICNISVVGLYVAVDPIPLFDQTVSVAFRLPGTDELVEAPAVVAWINPDEPTEVEALPPGCGLRFDGLEDDVAQAISAMVEDYLSIPRVLPPWFERPSDPTA